MPLRVRLPSCLLALALLPSLTACPGPQEEGEEEVGDTTESDTTESTESDAGESAGEQGESTGDTTDTTTDTGDTTGDTTDTTGDTTDTTGDTTGDPPPPEVEAACMAACEVFTSCLEPFPGCVEACVESHLDFEGECFDAQLAMTSCLAGLTCEEAQQFFEGAPEPYPCQAEEAAVCDAPACQAGVGMGENPGECSFEYLCPEQPVYEVVCDGSACTCIEDGVEVGGCSDAVEFCALVGDTAPANTCCGWTL